MMVDDVAAVVIDNGSDTCKAGFAGGDAPNILFRSLVGHSRQSSRPDSHTNDSFVGDEAQANRDMLNITHPIKHGLVTNWDAMELIWNHVFYKQLHVNPEERSVLVTEPPLNPTANREKMAQVMFETFNVPALFVAIPGVLSLYSSGQVTGTIVDCGEGVTHVLPMYEGHCKRSSIMRTDVAGGVVTDHLRKMLIYFPLKNARESSQQIKEKLAYVSQDFEKESKMALDCFTQSYTLPDNLKITIRDERFRCAEPLFRPSLLGLEIPGIHELAYNSIMKCGVDVRRGLCSHVVLTGGTSLLPGFVDRMRNELAALAPAANIPHVEAPPERKYSTWIGGSIVASLTTFPNLWISAEEYQEYGPSVAFKCY